MANIEKMQQVFDELLEKYGSSQRRLINTWAGTMGRQLDYEQEALKEEMAAFSKRFEDAKNEVIS